MSILLAFVLDFVLSLVFLLPLKDERGPGKRVPLTTWLLITVNTVAHVAARYVLPTALGEETWDSLELMLKTVPAAMLDGVGLGAASMVTAAFLHAGWSHLLGNMFVLFFFGRKVEDLLGHFKFALFYLACIFVSDIGSVLGRAALPLTRGTIPSLGASGAIMGVVAAYLFLYSEQRIRTLVVLFILPIPFPVKIPAWVFVLQTVLRDILNSFLEQELQAQGYLYSLVDSFAHLGGFVAGMTCLYLFLPAEVLYYRHRLRPSRAIRSRSQRR